MVAFRVSFQLVFLMISNKKPKCGHLRRIALVVVNFLIIAFSILVCSNDDYKKVFMVVLSEKWNSRSGSSVL